VQKKAELEEHMKALETATTRFKKYSWMNSNTMRRPLEKIKRLAELYELRDKKETLHDQILEATVELDKVVREMNGLLEAVPKAKMLTRPLHPEPAQRR
jgi:light-regulated signal transduction histidine kinase (bacteriophytochrome)